MTKGILGDREKALEDSYFRQQDAKLLKRLREGAALDDVAIALAEKLQLDNPEVLVRAREVGITPDTAAAFLVAPLVEIAWAEGSVTKQERSAVLRLALERGIDRALLDGLHFGLRCRQRHEDVLVLGHATLLSSTASTPSMSR